MSHNYNIFADGKRVNVTLPQMVDELSLIRYIPGSTIEYTGQVANIYRVDYSADFTVRIQEATYKPYYRCTSRHVVVSVTRFEDVIPDLPHLFYAVYRQLMINKQRYPVHSCVINKTMFIGHSGAGKTTLVLEAINQGMQVFSADRSLVEITRRGYIKLLAGTQDLSVRQSMPQPNLELICQRGDRNIYTSENLITPQQSPIEKIVLFKVGANSIEDQIFQPSIIHQLLPHFFDVEKQHCCITGAGILYSASHSAKVGATLVKNLSGIRADVFYKEGSIPEILEIAREPA